MGNALRHTPPGGTVEIRATSDGDGVARVVDTGEGIAPDDLHRVFDRSFRGDRSRTSDDAWAGLGLAIARGLVGAHGGEIKAESRLGSGSLFTFTLQST